MVVEHIEFDEVITLGTPKGTDDFDYIPEYFEYAVWPDGDTCPLEDVEEYMSSPCAKSDDYEVVGVLESAPTDRCDQCGGVAPGRYVFDVQGVPILFVCENCDHYE